MPSNQIIAGSFDKIKMEKAKKEKKDFNIVFCGVGGQGIITLLKVLAEAAFIDGYDIRTSELHGLSQRSGSVQAQARFGKKIYSPLVQAGQADLILSLEKNEALRTAFIAGEKTKFLINDKFISYFGGLSEKNVNAKLKKLGQNIYLIEAAKICREQIGKEVLAGIYLLSWASFQGLIPIKSKSVLKAIENTIPAKYLALNKKAFSLAKSI